MFPAWQVILTGVAAGVIAAVAVAALPFARRHRWYPIAGIASAAGWMAWNFGLDAAGATGFTEKAPLVPISGQDAGSGVAAFACAVLVLSALQSRAPAGQVTLAALVAGVAVTAWSLFVLA